MPDTPMMLPDHSSASVYRVATSADHYYSPESGELVPGPSTAPVMIVVPEPGWEFRYNIALDKTLVVESAQTPLPLRAHDILPAEMPPLPPPVLYSFADICSGLIAGKYSRAARQLWTDRSIGYDPVRAPHFTEYRAVKSGGEAVSVWNYRTTDMHARDWTITEVK